LLLTHCLLAACVRPCYERRQALESFTPRQLRLMFALQPWEKKMNYGEQVGFYYIVRTMCCF